MTEKMPILLVEDDMVDARTVERALRELNVTNPLLKAADGEEALEVLGNGKDKTPGLILLDLNMPRMDGLQLLSVLKKHETWRRIPVVVLTTSTEEEDRVRSFDLSVSGYMIKPVDYSQFVETMRTINMYWLLSEAADA